MKSICTLIVSILILTFNSSLLGRSSTQKTHKTEELVGTVVAADLPLLRACHLCYVPLIVRLSDTRHKRAKYVQLDVYYDPNSRLASNGFPLELTKRAGEWRFQAVRVKKKDTQFKQEFMKLTPVDIKGNVIGKEEQFPRWTLLPGAESEQLPFGQTLPYYWVDSNQYELAAKDK